MSTKYTPGPWRLKYYIDGSDSVEVETEDGQEDICHCLSHSDAKLIAEAGTIATETGKTPRQLADINAALLEALKKIAHQSEEVGRSGCNYGDTEFDSLSVCYGVNLQLTNDKQIALEAIKEATE